MHIARKRTLVLAAIAGLLLAACGGSNEETGTAIEEAPSASPSDEATAVAEESTPEPEETDVVEESTPEPEETDVAEESPKASNSSWDPVLYPDDLLGPTEVVDEIDLSVGQSILSPLEGVNVSWSQDGWTGQDAPDGLGTPCLNNEDDRDVTDADFTEAADNGVYRSGAMLDAVCPATVQMDILDPDTKALLHTITINITE